MKISVKVIPRSSRVSVLKITSTEYKIKLIASPADGKANQQLIEILADYFGVAKTCIEILKGQTARNKIIEINN